VVKEAKALVDELAMSQPEDSLASTGHSKRSDHASDHFGIV